MNKCSFVSLGLDTNDFSNLGLWHFPNRFDEAKSLICDTV